LPAEFKGFGQRNFIKRKKEMKTPCVSQTRQLDKHTFILAVGNENAVTCSTDAMKTVEISIFLQELH
jgi:hypothetical protein